MELTVMGAGIFGLCCAWEAVQRGAKVRVIDPNGAGAGASGGVVGALAPHAPENWTPAKSLQLEALLTAADYWAGVETAGGVTSGYARNGRVQVLADARSVELARQRAGAAVLLWQGRAEWTVRPADRAGDPVSPTGLVAHDTLTARINPRQAIPALVAALSASGVEVRTGGAPIGETVIWATGAEGLRNLSLALGRDIGRGEKGQALLMDGGLAPDAPQIYAPGLHIVPHRDGTVAIGSTSERDYSSATETDAQLDGLMARALEVLPALAQHNRIASWAGERPRAASRTLILDQWPNRGGHYIANGGFKTGFALAPVAAKMLLDLILTGQDQIPPSFRLG